MINTNIDWETSCKLCGNALENHYDPIDESKYAICMKQNCNDYSAFYKDNKIYFINFYLNSDILIELIDNKINIAALGIEFLYDDKYFQDFPELNKLKNLLPFI